MTMRSCTVHNREVRARADLTAHFLHFMRTERDDMQVRAEALAQVLCARSSKSRPSESKHPTLPAANVRGVIEAAG